MDVSHAGYVFSFYALVMFLVAPIFGKIVSIRLIFFSFKFHYLMPSALLFIYNTEINDIIKIVTIMIIIIIFIVITLDELH